MVCAECGEPIGMPGNDAYVVFDPDGDERRLCVECHDAQLWLSEASTEEG